MALSTPVIIRIPFQLTMVTAPFLWADLKDKMQPEVCIVLDMTKTRSIDSNGIDILKKALIRARQLNARLKLSGMNAAVKSRMYASGIGPKRSRQ